MHGLLVAVNHLGGYENQKTTVIAKDRIACGHAIGQLVFSWDGKAANCGFDGFVQHIWGDVSKESIKEIWNRRNQEMVQYHLKHRFDLLPIMCQHCENWKNIGEERFDENGNPIIKNYNVNEKMI